MSRTVAYRTPRERAAAGPLLRRHLREDGLVAYPTETVYGLGCALRSVALERLARFKGDRPFLLLIEASDQVPQLTWTTDARRLAARFWPGPLTLALPDPARSFPPQVRGPEGAVAVRVSPHPAVAALLQAAGGVVTSTSANRPGEPPARAAAEAKEAAEGVPDLVVLDGGELPDARPSTIVLCGSSSVRLLREGALSRQELQQVVELA